MSHKIPNNSATVELGGSGRQGVEGGVRTGEGTVLENGYQNSADNFTILAYIIRVVTKKEKKRDI